MTEQEIDWEILKNPKDKKEEYKKLKFQQVWKKLYDIQYRKEKKFNSKPKVNIPEDVVVAEILKEQQQLYLPK